MKCPNCDRVLELIIPGGSTFWGCPCTSDVPHGTYQLFTTKDFAGHYPVGTAAIVWARNRQQARRKFRVAFRRALLPENGGKFTIQPHDLVVGQVNILNDGEY